MIVREFENSSRGPFRSKGFGLGVPCALLGNLLPINEVFRVSHSKWTFAKATSVKWAKSKLKTFTVNVIGFVVDGVGSGQATLKKPAGGPWPWSSLFLTSDDIMCAKIGFTIALFMIYFAP